jgi:hypothetical protein
MKPDDKLNNCIELLKELKVYVERSLPTHLERGGDADRQRLLRRINKEIGNA